MPPLEPTAGSDDARPAEDLTEAGVYATSEQGHAHGLVVLAMGSSYCLAATAEGFRLLVEPSQVEATREQLAKYDRESVGWPPRAADPNPMLSHLALGTPVIWALAVATVFWAQTEWPGRLERWGELEPQALFVVGEWWRPLTALFLHADLMHLWSNLFLGALVFAVVCSTFGRLRSWLLLLGAAVVANTSVAALAFPGPYRSLGASTAVFAGLGLLTGRAVRVAWRSAPLIRWREAFVPLGGGLTLLALHAGGGPRTDVAAHVAGFAAGFLAGVLAAWWQASPTRAEKGEN